MISYHFLTLVDEKECCIFSLICETEKTFFSTFSDSFGHKFSSHKYLYNRFYITCSYTLKNKKNRYWPVVWNVLSVINMNICCFKIGVADTSEVLQL